MRDTGGLIHSHSSHRGGEEINKEDGKIDRRNTYGLMRAGPRLLLSLPFRWVRSLFADSIGRQFAAAWV